MVVAVAAAMAAPGLGSAQNDKPALAAGLYTEQQVERGAPTYAANCALCHGADMTGGPGAPALTGPEFAFSWTGKPVGDLLDYARKNMPPGQAGSLSDQQYADVVAGILKANGMPAGARELPVSPDALKDVTITRPK